MQLLLLWECCSDWMVKINKTVSPSAVSLLLQHFINYCYWPLANLGYVVLDRYTHKSAYPD